MRKLMLILTTLMLIALSPTPTHAQNDPATTWYWATAPEGLVAYTADGQANLIYAGPEFYGTDYLSARLTHDTALIRGGDVYYLATSETARIIPLAPALNNLRPFAYHHPYVLLVETETVMPGAVLNIETFEAVALADELFNPPALMPDGITLRYVGVTFSDGQFLSPTLYEQNIATSELSTVMTLAPNTPFVNSGDGRFWWVTDESGTFQAIGDPDPQFTAWLQSGEAEVHGDWLWHLSPTCEPTCTLDIVSLVDDATFTLTLPDGMVTFPDRLEILPDGSIGFVGTAATRRLWLQNPDGTLLELGEIDYGIIGGEFIAPDAQWAVAMGRTAEGGPTVRLWDLPKRAVVYEAPFSDFAYHLFAGDTVAFYHDGRSQMLYWNGTATPLDAFASTLYQYPDNFFQILSGGHAFYQHPDGGIYRFDAATQELSLLVPAGKYISVYKVP